MDDAPPERDSMATLSPDQTQPPRKYRRDELPNFSFLDKVTKTDADGLMSPIPYRELEKELSASMKSPMPAGPQSNKTPGSAKRLGRLVLASSFNLLYNA